ncbi:MAG: hypothetical protein AB7T31_09325 [Gemmatimonadales bacterium]
MSLRTLVFAFVAVIGVALLPDAAHACAMCFSGSDETRRAFFSTAAFLTLLPLGMLAGTTTWLRSRARRAEAEDGDPAAAGRDEDSGASAR